jgi:Peptidase C13 family/YcxB-like protein
MLQLNAYVSAEDLQRDIAFVKADSKLNYQSPWPRYIGLSVFFFILSFLYLRYASKVTIDAGDQYLIILTAVMFIVATVWTLIWYKNGGLVAWLATCSGDYQWQLNAQGISVKVKEASNLIPWSSIIALVESDEAWYFYARRNLAVSIPKKATDTAQLVSNMASEYWRKHPDNHGLTLQNNLNQGLRQKSFWADLSTNLLGGMQLAFFAKVSALNFKVRTSQWLALIALEILIIAFFDYCTAGVNPQFNIYGLTHYSANYLLLLLAGLYIMHIALATPWLGRLVIMLLAATIVMELVFLPIRTTFILKDGYADNWLNWLAWGLYVVWLLLVAGRSIRKLLNYPMPTILLLTTFYSFFVLVMPGVLIQQSFFTEDYQAKYADKKIKEIDVEATYYKQADLVDEAVAALKPQRAGQVDLYYVGFAGYAYQKVFSNEVKFVKKLLDEKHDTAGRSTLLINHEDSIDKIPLANAYNLGSTLNGVASAMDTDEDVLFLFLSSHGSKDFKISTDFYPLGSNDLPASKVKVLLDKSGIKNRIIVVSACYSGGFIDVLKDENTLILTASKKDRSSFGCSDEAQYTYFGEAYFIQALKEERSFVKAFEIAKKLISAKEKKEQKDSPASQPQMYEGGAIKAKLAALEASLKAPK